MNIRIIAIAACLALAAGPASAADKVELKTLKDKQSYAIGLDMGGSIKRNDLDINVDMLTAGIRDAIAGGSTLMTEQEMRETMMALQKELQAKMTERMKTQAKENKEKGEAYLAENAKKPGVKTLPDGLQYKVISEGKGAKPKENDTVTVNYRGTLIDGTEFDNSNKRKEPSSFPVRAVIKGWTEALLMMKEGAKWQLFIPAGLAYGDQGRPGIPPGSVLVFDVELVKISPAK